MYCGTSTCCTMSLSVISCWGHFKSRCSLFVQCIRMAAGRWRFTIGWLHCCAMGNVCSAHNMHRPFCRAKRSSWQVSLFRLCRGPHIVPRLVLIPSSSLLPMSPPKSLHLWISMTLSSLCFASHGGGCQARQMHATGVQQCTYVREPGVL